MKIAYIGQMADVSSENGISKKIAAQTATWRAMDHDVRYFTVATTAERWPGLGLLETVIFSGDAASRFGRSVLLAQRVRAWSPDVIYFRYAYHSPGLPRLFRDVPTVAEINSDDRREYPLTLDPIRVLYHRLTRKRVLRPIAGFVAVTEELAGRFAEWKRPTVAIGNGISLEQFGVLATPKSDAPPSVVFLGSAGSPWHGLERAAELAGLLPEFRFDLVGIDATAWQRQVPGIAVPTNIRLHGHLSRTAYEPLVAGAAAALGSLALYKNGMEEACPLKVREYLALGLPVIAGYRDTDVPENADYFLRLPNDNQPLAPLRPRLVEFLHSWQQRRVARTAVAHLDYAVKEKQRLEFIAQIAASAHIHR